MRIRRAAPAVSAEAVVRVGQREPDEQAGDQDGHAEDHQLGQRDVLHLAAFQEAAPQLATSHPPIVSASSSRGMSPALCWPSASNVTTYFAPCSSA